MQKLGVVENSCAAGARDFDKCKSTFAAPLSASKYKALQELFSGGFDSMAMDLELAGLDDEVA